MNGRRFPPGTTRLTIWTSLLPLPATPPLDEYALSVMRVRRQPKLLAWSKNQISGKLSTTRTSHKVPIWRHQDKVKIKPTANPSLKAYQAIINPLPTRTSARIEAMPDQSNTSSNAIKMDIPHSPSDPQVELETPIEDIAFANRAYPGNGHTVINSFWERTGVTSIAA